MSLIDQINTLATRVATEFKSHLAAADPHPQYTTAVEVAVLIPPVGTIVMYGSTTIPAHWLVCNGASVARTLYPALYAVLGTSFGAGNGTTDFILPDFQGRAPIGVGTGTGLSNRPIGVFMGSEAHTLTSSESGVSAHQHANTATTAATSHGHVGSTAANESAHTHGAGSYKARRSSYAGANNTAAMASSAVNQGSATDDIVIVGTSGAGSAHSHTLTIAAEAAHTHSVTVTNVNNATANAASAHNNMQPSLPVVFIIRAE